MRLALPPRVVRRVLGPVLLVAELVLLVVFAAAAVVCLVPAAFTRRRRPLRLCAFAVGYLSIEVAALVVLFALWLRHPGGGRSGPDRDRWEATHRRLLGWALGRILGWGGRCAGFRVVIERPSGAADGDDGGLSSDEPVLVLARHAGPGDSFALVHLLLRHHQRGVRIVLKDILQADPALDIALNRLGCCFLPSTGAAPDDLPARLAALAGTLAGRDTLLVFPEGGNWTPRRRHRAIRRLRLDGKAAAASAAMLMDHVLPPRPAGVLAVLEAHPELPVVLVAHAGLDRITSFGQGWRALPFTTPMTVRAWPASPFPLQGQDAQLAWLTAEWAIVDQWVDRHGHPAAPGG